MKAHIRESQVRWTMSDEFDDDFETIEGRFWWEETMGHGYTLFLFTLCSLRGGGTFHSLLGFILLSQFCYFCFSAMLGFPVQ
jgi:hypothetical protein